MDRSSLRRVETTTDNEKRLAFKNQLAEKVVVAEEISEPSIPSSSLSIPLGTMVWHPDLGPCTVFFIDRNMNSIVLESASLGKIDLVLSQVESKLVPANKDGEPAHADKASHGFVNPSLIDAAETVSSMNWGRIDPEVLADTEKRLEAEQSQVDSAPMVNGIPVGTRVWHPDLGPCTVFSVDEPRNSLVLDFPDRGKIEMALRQVSSSLFPIGPDGEPIYRSGQAPPVLPASPVEKLETFSPTNWGRTSPEALRETEQRLASQEPRTEIVRTAAGVPVGSVVWHPGLGPCTIFSIDRKQNSIVLESPSLGKIDLVLSQVESVLIPDENGAPAYTNKFAPAFVAPTLIDSGEALSPTNWHRADQPTIYTEKKTPAKKETVKSVPGHLPVGASVWHPDFGACTVSSIDLKANTIVLDFATFGTLDMVLSQAEPKLLPIRREAPSHVGKLPKAKGASTGLADEGAPGESSPQSVALPPVFKTWKPLEQFSYLTREKHLTTDQANQFVAALSGRFAITPAFEVVWTEVLDKEKKTAFKQNLLDRVSKEPVTESLPPMVDTTPQPLSEVLSLSVTLPSIFKTLAPSGQYVFLTKTKHLTPEEANDVLAVHGGTSPRNDKVQFAILWDDQIGPSESGVHRVLKTPVIKEPALKDATGPAGLALPQAFKEWKPLEQFQYLTSNKHLTSLAANNVIEAVLYNSACDFDIVWEELAETEKRAVYKDNLLKKVQESLLKEAVDPVAGAVDTTPQPLSEVVSLSVTLPSIFKTLPLSAQYTFLTKTKHLTPEEANDVLAVHGGSAPRNVKVRFEILWDDQVGASEFGVRRVVKEPQAEGQVEVAAERGVLGLPQVFKTWKPVEQYQYLTSNKRLTTLAANRVIEAVLHNAPCDFDIVWGEVAEGEKRAVYKENLLKKVERDLRKEVTIAPLAVDTTPQPLSEVLSLSVTLPAIFKSLQASGQYAFLTKTKHLTPEEANDVIAVYRDTEPRNPTVKFEILWDDQDGISEFGVRRVLKTPEVMVEAPVIRETIDLPQIFKTWKPLEQFQYLTANKHLTSRAANNVIEAVLYNFTSDFDLVWEELPETEKRLAYKENLLKKVEAAGVVEAEPMVAALPAAMTHVGVRRIMGDTKVAKKVLVPGPQRLSVSVPHEFKTWNASDQYTFFTKTKKLTPNEANDLISVYNGARPHDDTMQYEFVWDSLSVGLDPTQVRRSTDAVEIEMSEIVSELHKLSVTLPQAYKKWRPADQFAFLTHTKRLSTGEANDIIATANGDSIRNTKTVFEIIWDGK